MGSVSSGDSSTTSATVVEELSLCLRGFSGRGDEHLVECLQGKISFLSKIPSNASYRKALCELRDVEKVFLSLGKYPVSAEKVFQINQEFECLEFQTVSEVVTHWVGECQDLEKMVEAGLENDPIVSPDSLSLADKLRLSLVCAFASDLEVLHVDFEGIELGVSEAEVVANLMIESTPSSGKVVVVTGLEQIPEPWLQSANVSIKGSANRNSSIIEKAKSPSVSEGSSVEKRLVSSRAKRKSSRTSTLTKVEKISSFSRVVSKLKFLKLPSRKSSGNVLDD